MRFSFLLLLIAPAWATTTISSIEPTATQAVITVSTDQGGNCTYIASEGSALGTPVNDVNPSLFPGSNSDTRPGAFPGQSILMVATVHTFVLGTRGQAGVQISSFDNRAYSRALQMNTLHTVGVTCGSDAQVTATFTTVNPTGGVSYREPRFWRASPGDYAYPSQNWTNRGVCTIDPETGACVKLAALPGDFLSNSVANQAQTFLPNLAGGTGWTGSRQAWSYSGQSQGFLFLPITPLSIVNGSVVLSENSTSGPTWLQLTAMLSGSAPAVLVCLSVNGGQSCASGKISQAITATPANYTIGTQTPILESWRNGPRPPISQSDIVTQTGAVNKSGTTVTWTSGNYFLPTRWNAGSTIVLGNSTCVIASMQSDVSLTLASASCAADGSGIAYSATNFGFLIQASTSSNVTVSVAAPKWSIGSSGWVGMPSAGFLNDICQIVSVTGPTGPGNLCSPSASYGPPNQYNNSNMIFWIGQDGTVNLIGPSAGANAPPGGFTDSACGGNMVFDGLIGGRFYCGRYTGGGASFGIFYVQYNGTYTAVNPTFGSTLPNSTAATVAADVNALVQTYDTSGNFAAFRAAYPAPFPPGWNIVSWQANGKNGALLLEARLAGGQADSAAIWAVLSLDTNTIIAMMCTYCGPAGSPNRWMGDHSGVGTRQYQTLIDTAPLELISPAIQPYVVNTTGTLGPAPWLPCPSAYGASGNNCSSLALSSLTPADSMGNMLPGVGGPQTILPGDYMQIDGECVRIVELSGLFATVFRNQWTQFAGFGVCGQSTSHAGNLPATMFSSAYTELIWSWATDPHGTALTMDPDSADCHYGFTLDAMILGCVNGNFPNVPGKPIRLGPYPQNPGNPFFYVNWDAGFGNSFVPYIPPPDNYMETHPSKTQELASSVEQKHFIDNRPYMGFSIPSTPAAKVGTFVYRVPPASLPGYSYRVHSWWVGTNTKIAVDVSGPGSVLHDATVDNYKFCEVLMAGECWPGSSPGEVYVNFPYVSSTVGYHCRFRPPVNDIAIDEMYMSVQGVVEAAINRGADPNGQGVRQLTTGFSQKCTQSIFWNSREVAPGGWVYTTVDYLDGVNAQPILIKKPPTPPNTSVNLDTAVDFPDGANGQPLISRRPHPAATVNLADFIPVQFGFGSGTPGDSIKIQLGYAEYDQGQLAAGQVPPCNPRNEGCFTDSSGANPFVWASEPQQPAACAEGCAVTARILPAPGGRVVYFRVIRTNGGSTTLGPIEVMVVGTHGPERGVSLATP